MPMITFYCRHPEFFYPKKFVTIKSAEKARLDTSMVTKIYHGTHQDEVKEICAAPNIATFVGKEKQWRPGTVFNKDEQTLSLQYCSYIVDKEPIPMTKDKQWQFGPFLWFGTKRDDANIYGTYCFEFQFKSVLKKYQQKRRNCICYRAGGTLLYKDEITHVVIICCEDDQEYALYPLIVGNSTNYFNPECIEPPCSFEDASIEGSVYSATNTNLPRNRHEHIALAFYLPHGLTLQLNNQDGKLHDISKDHVEYCVKTPGKYKKCELSEVDASDISDFNIPFDYDAFFN